jgi:hypothetical protein
MTYLDKSLKRLHALFADALPRAILVPLTKC